MYFYAQQKLDIGMKKVLCAIEKAGAVMTDSDPETKSKQTILLSRLSMILPGVAGIMILALLVFLGVTANFEMRQIRTGAGLAVARDVSCREMENADAPIGIIREYTFTLTEGVERDTYLSFYTVHQYVEVYIDGQLVYSMKPSGKLFAKTVGSNWTMIPLCREDAGKEIRVNIIPVYESFRNREVQFLVGSTLSVYLDRLYQDWPQLFLSVMAILVGIVFGCIAVYKLIHERSDGGLAGLGLFSVMTGLWRLTDTRFTPFLAPEKPVLMFYISVTMLMIGSVPLIKSMEVRFNKTSRRVMDGYCIATAVVCIIQLLFQIFGGVDLRENFYVIHFVVVLGVVVFVGNVIYDWAKYSRKQKGGGSPKAALVLVAGIVADGVAFYVRGTSSGLLFSLLAMIIYIIFTGVKMMFHYIGQEKQLAEKERILAENERQITESRISTMISQIRPHFIYNTLGSIEQLCELQPEAAAKLVHNFSRYLRGNFSELDNHAPIHLSQEIEHIRYYVSIEQIRFPDMEIRFDLQSDDFLLPALSVQPLVENAIKHGLMKLPKGGTVTVSSYETDTHYCISVEDNGAGFDTSILLDERKHIGLRNIRGRVEAMCGGTLSVESTPGVGTKVVISIPKGEIK